MLKLSVNTEMNNTLFASTADLPDGGIVVNVREGSYPFLDAPFTLENVDSGTPNSQIM